MPNLQKNKLDPIGWFKWLKTLPSKVFQVLSYMVLILFYAILSLVRKIAKKVQFFHKIEQRLMRVIKFLNHPQPGSISRIELIDLALQNMQSKKSRTYITVGGMTIGIAAIVFLVSIGYGLQSMVIKRVARLEEMRQTDVTTQPGSKLSLDNDVLKVFSEFENVEMALPQIAVVGKVNFNNSSTDMAAYGVTKEYLAQSAIAPVVGRMFESDQTETTVEGKTETYNQIQSNSDSEIASAGDKIQSVNFTVNSGEWIEVRDAANTDAQVIGYISNQIGQTVADEVWGDSYEDPKGDGTAGQSAAGAALGKWVKARVPIWTESGDSYEPVETDEGQQRVTGYLTTTGLSIVASEAAEENDSVVKTDSNGVVSEWVNLEGESDTAERLQVTKVSLPDSITDREAVVNRGFLKVLGLDENQAVGKTFKVSFIATGKLLGEQQDRIESTEIEYEIVGVTPDERTPLFYVPFVHLRSLGLVNFSQLKVVVDKESHLADVRKRIEGQGFTTSSVTDTVAQINSLFQTARMLLALVGMVALSVAALGMFNTLTVSLLERTREVGLLKAMGMKSYEIRDLFLAESMIMGSMGGILGIVVGLLVGKVLEIGLSVFAVVKGAGMITIVDIPLLFAFMIVFLSFLVGVFTGIYPARRATKISALNALRYE